jgi:four helix bundle protein
MTKYTDPPGFAEWEATVPESFRDDTIWKAPAYRYAVWIGDLAAKDMEPLLRDPDLRETARQLVRAAESISTNFAEGYGKTTGPDRAKFYDISSGSTRVCRDWYYKLRNHLAAGALEQRLDLLARIMRILNAIIPRERADTIGRARRARTRKRHSP